MVPKGTAPTSDKMAVYLSELQRATALTENRRVNGHFIPVPTSRWRSLLGGNYRQVIDESLALRYAEPNERYKVGNFPKSYRLMDGHRVHEVTPYLLKRRRNAAANRVNIHPEDTAGAAIACYLDQVTVPDVQVADPWVGFNLGVVQRGEHFATRCRHGRFHSSFGCLPGSIRRQSLIGGACASEVDVSNCQPLILGALTLLALKGIKTEKGKERGEREGNGEGGYDGWSPSHTNMLHSLSKTRSVVSARAGCPNRLVEYLQVCETGRLYAVIGAACSEMGLRLFDFVPEERRKPWTKNGPVPRSVIKRSLLTMTFSDLKTMLDMPMFRVFARLFPEVAAFLVAEKSVCHKALASLCQWVESAIMINGATALLAERFPVIPVHDSILAPKDRAGEVTGVIRATFAMVGLNVCVKAS